MTTFHSNLKYNVIETERHDFSLTDQKGRAIGFVWTIRSVTSTPGGGCGYNLDFADNKFFSLSSGTTRDGEGFGASTATFFALTRIEIEAEASRRMAVSRKRYTKKYGG